MWQHAANIIIGLVLTALAVFGRLLNVVQPLFAWLFIGAGIGIIAFGTWGLTDEFAHEANSKDLGMEI